MTYAVDAWALFAGIAVIAITVPLLTWLIIERAMVKRVDAALGRLVRLGMDLPPGQAGSPLGRPLPRRREPTFAENVFDPAGQI